MTETETPPAQSPPAHGLRGTASAILYIFLWASAFVPSRVISRSAPPLWVLALRLSVAGALLFGGVLLAKLPLPRDRGTWLRLALLGLCSNSLYLGLTYLALHHLSAGMGAIIASTNPLLLALAGVIASVAATILYKRMKNRPHLVVLNAAQLLFAGVLLVPAAVVLEGAPRIPWTPAVLASLGYLIIVLSLGASMLWFTILRHGEASRVSAFYFLTPIFGLGLGALILGERLVPLDGVGLLVIAAGLWLTTRG